jgi:hypothetical protein
MPPHCDSLDGPVVTAARAALERHDVRLILPYVKASGEVEVRDAFERAIGVRNGNAAANELADLYFFETVVRVHRAGEGAPYTGLKPAGLPVGPVIPVAERAIEAGDASELVGLLTEKVHSEIELRFHDIMERKPHATDSVEAARGYVEAMLGLEVWSHKVYGCLDGGAHDTEADEVHHHG